LVRCYHGLGDTVQFARLLPLLRARCTSVALWAQPALLELLRSCAGIDRLEPLHDGEPDIDRDIDIELLELPHALRLTLESIPARVPYIHPHDESGGRMREAAFANRDRRAPRVGLCWLSGDWDPARSVPRGTLRPLMHVPGLRWFSLQYPPRSRPFPMFDLACRDLHAFAARMLHLDLVISVDTLTAHLAGAMGLPVWLLLPTQCDWRWLRARGDSPWYPTMRLVRQRRAGEWERVIESVATALHVFSSSFARGGASTGPLAASYGNVAAARAPGCNA
jgi:hypothetical protein